jgi:hypothetical protein
MTKKWIAINFLLLGIAGLLGWQLRASILRFNARNDLAKIQPVQSIKQKTVHEKSLPQLMPAKSYTPDEFALIPEQNMFSESRGKEDTTEIAAPPVTPPLVQKPILVGVTIFEDQRKALIIDPTSPAQDKSRRTQVKRIGDVYQGYTITDIALDHIVLESGSRREIIPLHEGTKRVQGGRTPILSTRVVNFGGGGTSGGVQVAAVAGSAPVRTTVAPVASATPPSQPGIEQAPPGSVRTTGTTQQTPQSLRQQRTTPATDSQGRRLMRTPFGDVVRPPDRD